METSALVASDDEDLWNNQSPTWDDATTPISADPSPRTITKSVLPFAVPSSSATVAMTNNGQLSPISTSTCFNGSANTVHFLAAVEMSGCNSDSRMHEAGLPTHRRRTWTIGDRRPEVVTTVSESPLDSYEWRSDHDAELVQPKPEPFDEDELCLADLQEAPLTPVPSNDEPTPTQSVGKRPRGRPRKHPLNSAVSSIKIAKGRSKTGCLTCRKRKKKCDEAKPRCMNCEKNAVICEGYPEKQVWKSGRDRTDGERLEGHALPAISMQALFEGLETHEDRIFWKHYNEHLSAVLTVEGEHSNAFRNLVVTIAVKHEGLMHSVLSLSSKHIDYETPYGARILGDPSNSLEALQDRSEYHSKRAMDILQRDLGTIHEKNDADGGTLLHARYGQILCLLLEAMVDGDSTGAHRYHLTAYQLMIRDSPPTDPALNAFVTEFFHYHVLADELLRHPSNDRSRLSPITWPLSSEIPSPRLLGVADGLLNLLPQVTALRDTVRANLQAHIHPPTNYDVICSAADIEAGLLKWSPQWPHGDSRASVALLYKQMMWIYLASSVTPPDTAWSVTMPPSTNTMDFAATETHPADFPTRLDSNGYRTVPTQVPMSTNSSPTLQHHLPQPASSSARRQSMHEFGQTQHGDIRDYYLSGSILGEEASGSPARQSPAYITKTSVPLGECLDILEGIKPSDPCQALLLIPCLIIGTVCQGTTQRDRLRSAIKVIRGYRGLRNIDRVTELLEAAWRAMDRGDWLAAWDWQDLARQLDLDFLCA